MPRAVLAILSSFILFISVPASGQIIAGGQLDVHPSGALTDYSVVSIPWRAMKDSNLTLGSPISPDSLIAYTKIVSSPFDSACLTAAFNDVKTSLAYQGVVSDVIRNIDEQTKDNATAITASGSYGLTKVSFASNKRHFAYTKGQNGYAYLYIIHETARKSPKLEAFSACVSKEARDQVAAMKAALSPSAPDVQHALALKEAFRTKYGTGFVADATFGGIVELTTTNSSVVRLSNDDARLAMSASYRSSKTSYTSQNKEEIKLEEVREGTQAHVYGGDTTLMNDALQAQFGYAASRLSEADFSKKLTDWGHSVDTTTNEMAIRGWAVAYSVLPELRDIATPADVELSGSVDVVSSFPSFSSETVEPWVGSVLRIRRGSTEGAASSGTDALYWANTLIPTGLVDEKSKGISRYFVEFRVDQAGGLNDSNPIGFAYEQVKDRLAGDSKFSVLLAPRYFSAAPALGMYPVLSVVVESGNGPMISRTIHPLNTFTYPARLGDVVNTILVTKSAPTVRFEYSEADNRVIREALNDGTLQFSTVYVGENYDEASSWPLNVRTKPADPQFYYDMPRQTAFAMTCASDGSSCWKERKSLFDKYVVEGPKTAQTTTFNDTNRAVFAVGYYEDNRQGFAMLADPPPPQLYHVAGTGPLVTLWKAWQDHVGPSRRVAGSIEKVLHFRPSPHKPYIYPKFCDGAGEHCEFVYPKPVACIVDADLYAWQERNGRTGEAHCH